MDDTNSNQIKHPKIHVFSKNFNTPFGTIFLVFGVCWKYLRKRDIDNNLSKEECE